MHRPPVPFYSSFSSFSESEASSETPTIYTQSLPNSFTHLLVNMPARSKSVGKTRRYSEVIPIKPPPYTPRPPIVRRNRSKSRRSERQTRTMFITKLEKCFLVLFTTFALLSLLSTFGAIFIDKNAITGNQSNKSICMLSETNDCFTEYTSLLPKIVVQVGVRVDLMLSCVTFTIGVMFLSFKYFNSRVLVGFLLFGTFKMIFLCSVVLVILTNTEFYFESLNYAFSGMCFDPLCVTEDRVNIVVAFVLLLASGFTTACMMFTVFTIGSRILKKIEDQHYEATWAKWDAMTADLVAF